MWQTGRLARYYSQGHGRRQIKSRLSPWRLAALSLMIGLPTVSCTGSLQTTEAPPGNDQGIYADAESGDIGKVRESMWFSRAKGSTISRENSTSVIPPSRRRIRGSTSFRRGRPPADHPRPVRRPRCAAAGIVINLAQYRMFYFPPGGGRVGPIPSALGSSAKKKTPLRRHERGAEGQGRPGIRRLRSGRSGPSCRR